jgi:hypothetical protein
MILAAIIATLSFSQAPVNEPTDQEIAVATGRSRGGSGTFAPAFNYLQIETIAKNIGSYADDQIMVTMPFRQESVQMKPILVVKQNGLKACR